MLKINQILKAFEVKRGTNKQGKPYEIHTWTANAEVDGQNLQNIIVKSFKAIDFDAEKEFKYKKDEFHDMNTGNIIVSYMLMPAQQKKPWGSKPTYTLVEYDMLFAHALKKFETKFQSIPISDPYQKWEIIQKLVSTYCIGATGAGVKVEKKTENPVMNNDDKPINDDDIPW